MVLILVRVPIRWLAQIRIIQLRFIYSGTFYKGVPRVLKKKKTTKELWGNNPGLRAEALFLPPWHKETKRSSG